MTLKIVNFMPAYLSMIPFPLPATFCQPSLLSQMFCRRQRWRKRAPCCRMVPSTAASTSWGRQATAAQPKAASPPRTPPLRYCSPTASMSWLWTDQIPAGRLLCRHSRKWQIWVTRSQIGALAMVITIKKRLLCSVY